MSDSAADVAPPADHHGEVHSDQGEGGGGGGDDGVGVVEPVQDLPASLLLSTCPGPPAPAPPAPRLLQSEEEPDGGGGGSGWDGELPVCGQLERKWLLWQQLMQEQRHLEAWLQAAEQVLVQPEPRCLPYTPAREELARLERLRAEARSALVQLDLLNDGSRTLSRLFPGALQTRLRASLRECGQRWDQVTTRLENITAPLQSFVSEWEGFQAEREDLELLLADVDVRLSEVEHLTGDTCEKLRQLQSFQQCVCANCERVSALLQRGEALIQRCHAHDAQQVELQLLELLHRCSLVHGNIASSHTRLLSMRLVFEDDLVLSPAPDSGCPSESLLEEEALLDLASLDPLPVGPNPPRGERPRPPAPPTLPAPTHEHLGLEWDPSVDIGRSVSLYDGDSLYFIANTGGARGDGVRRRSFLGSWSDASGEAEAEADLTSDPWLDQNQNQNPVVGAGTSVAASTPNRGDGSWTASFDGGRVRAWLGVQQNLQGRASCSRAVQTDPGCADGSRTEALSSLQVLHRTQESHDQEPPHDAATSHHQQQQPQQQQHRGSSLQAEGEEAFSGKEHEQLLSEPSRSSPPRLLQWPPAAAAVAVLAGLLLLLLLHLLLSQEQPCQRSNRMHRGFHLMLSYVSGPPPT